METPAAPPRWEIGASIDHLTRLLRLPDVGQDWDLEAADPARVAEFCDLYETGELDTQTQFALVSLLVASLDDALKQEAAPEGIDVRVERLLRRDFVLHLHTIYRWSFFESEDVDEEFLLTQMMRRVWADCFFKPEYQPWLEPL